MNNRIGFMQGRLSPIINGKIQSFPWDNWENEIIQASMLGINKMEWTLDQKDLYSNPLMTNKGQSKIKKYCRNNKIEIPSITGDCFMQFPFWKNTDDKAIKLENDFLNIVKACKAIGISLIVVPLVDNGRIENQKQEENVVNFFNENVNFFNKNNIKIIFESDLPPKKLASFINKFDSPIFGINYDTGNSASLGYDSFEEIYSYGNRILNVHIKDRELNGTTVGLGEVNTDFNMIFSQLKKISYDGNFILQTARAVDNNHQAVLLKYYKMTNEWIKKYSL